MEVMVVDGDALTGRASQRVTPVGRKTHIGRLSFSSRTQHQVLSLNAMPDDQDALISLNSHPIFSLPKEFSGPLAQPESSLELSTTTLPKFRNDSPTQDGPTPSGRRQIMILRDSDVIVAAGKEIRMTHLGDGKFSHSSEKQYKVCFQCLYNEPCAQF